MYVVLPNANGHAWGSARCVTSTQTAFEGQGWGGNCASDGSDERLPPAQSWKRLTVAFFCCSGAASGGAICSQGAIQSVEDSRMATEETSAARRRFDPFDRSRGSMRPLHTQRPTFRASGHITSPVHLLTAQLYHRHRCAPRGRDVALGTCGDHSRADSGPKGTERPYCLRDGPREKTAPIAKYLKLVIPEGIACDDVLHATEPWLP